MTSFVLALVSSNAWENISKKKGSNFGYIYSMIYVVEYLGNIVWHNRIVRDPWTQGYLRSNPRVGTVSVVTRSGPICDALWSERRRSLKGRMSGLVTDIIQTFVIENIFKPTSCIISFTRQVNADLKLWDHKLDMGSSLTLSTAMASISTKAPFGKLAAC